MSSQVTRQLYSDLKWNPEDSSRNILENTFISTHKSILLTHREGFTLTSTT